MSKEIRKVRRLIDFESPAQYKKFRMMAEQKGLNAKTLTESLIAKAITEFNNRQLKLFELQKKNV
jgi:hypothetical protein